LARAVMILARNILVSLTTCFFVRMQVHLLRFASHWTASSEEWTNRHPPSSKGMSRQCETSSGSWPQEHMLLYCQEH